MLTELDKVLFYLGRREVPFESSFEKVPSEVKEKLLMEYHLKYAWHCLHLEPILPNQRPHVPQEWKNESNLI